MGNTKNHRHNKNKQTKKYKKRLGGGFYEDAAKDLFEEWDADNSETLNETEYNNIKTKRMPYLPDFRDVDTDPNSKGIDLNEFTAAFIFTSFAQAKTLSENNYKNLQKSLPKFNNVPFSDMDKDNSGSIEFDEFLAAYKKSGGGRRRRKRSTRNKRKSNKKRRTVKRRKSAKRSRRRK